MKKEDFVDSDTGTLETIRGQRQTAIGIQPYETMAFTPRDLDEYPSQLTVETFSALTKASNALSRLDEFPRGPRA